MTENNQKKLTRSQLQSRKVKQGSSIGGKGIIIGIGVFFLLLVLIIFFFFFYLTSNPSVGKGIGMGPSTIKSITFVFAGLLFGSLFIIFLILGLTYLYKLLTKDTSKLKNGIGTFIIFILGTANLVFGWIVFSKINNINTNNIINTTNVLIGNVNFANKNNPGEIKYLPLYKNNFPLIAPIAISFQLNENVFNNTYYNRLRLDEGTINPVRFELNCGNGQILKYTNYKFPQKNKYCLYLHKGTYDISFKFVYSTKNQNNKELILPGKTIKIDSDIDFVSPMKLSPNKDEIIVGERTDEVKLDLRKIPSDLGLDKNTIDIDFEGNNKFQTLRGIVKHRYNTDKKYYIAIRLPNEQYPYYTFPIRVNPSTKPTCVINSKENIGTYTFIIKGDSPNGSIKQYNYEIKDISNAETIKKGRGEIIKTSLKNGSDYQVIGYITDTEGNIGSCKSNIIKLSSKRNYKYNVKVYDENKNEITYTGNTVIVNEIPKAFTLRIGNIVGGKENINTIGFDTNLDGTIDKKSNTLDITIKKDTKINTIIEDIYGNSANKTIVFKVEQKKVIARLNTNTHKGDIPLKVKFDASTSKSTEGGDNIIYFQWDFGDGEKLQNTRRGNLEHTYKKAGTYIAKVTVESEKGYKDTATKKIIVYKPINTANIIFPNNLGGQIKAGNSLKINLQTSGNIKEVKWDFGDGETFSCSGRECMNVNHRYEKKGIYRIQAKISYLDGSPSTTANSSINVIE